MYASASNSFKLMRCEHLKTRADDLHAKQRYREAADAYARTIEVIRVGGNGTTGQQCDRYLDVHMAVRLHSNRSLSLLKCASDEALRDSLRDALTCVRLAPTWTKGYWRVAAVLREQRKYLSAIRALCAFVSITTRDMRRLGTPESAEDASKKQREREADYSSGMRQLRQLLPKLTRTELAEAIVDICDTYVEGGDGVERPGAGSSRSATIDSDDGGPVGDGAAPPAADETDATREIFPVESLIDADLRRGWSCDASTGSLIAPVELETLSREQQVEALFRIIKGEHQRSTPSDQPAWDSCGFEYALGGRSDTDDALLMGDSIVALERHCVGLQTYHRILLCLLLLRTFAVASPVMVSSSSLTDALTVNLYCLRSAIHCRARSWSQALRDALTGVHRAKLAAAAAGGAATEPTADSGSRLQLLVAKAYYSLGSAYSAEKEAVEKDNTKALMSLTLASDIINGVRGTRDASSDGVARVDWEADCEALLRSVGSEMTGKQVSDAVRELYENTDAVIGSGKSNGLGIGMMTAMEMGIDSRAGGGGLSDGLPRIMRVDVDFVLPGGTPKDFSAPVRNALREDLSELASLPLKRVMIDGVRQIKRAPGDAGRGWPAAEKDLLINVKVTVGSSPEDADRLVDAIAGPRSSESVESDVEFLGAERVLSALPEQSLGLLVRSVRAVDAAPRKPGTSASEGRSGSSHADFDKFPSSGPDDGRSQGDDSTAAGGPSSSALRERVPPPPPALALELSYEGYRLVDVDGHTVEVPNKHPFMMTRVYYNSKQQQKEVYVQIGETNFVQSAQVRAPRCVCRWHQSASSIHVVAVISDAVSAACSGRGTAHGVTAQDRELRSQIGVSISNGHLKIYNKRRPHQYLGGELERQVIAEDSFWNFDETIADAGILREDPCVATVVVSVYLTKLNLELLNSPHEHGKSWWDRLMRHHAAIKFDDYDKDYSDLPEPILSAYNRNNLQDTEKGRIETGAKNERETLQEADDVRVRARQERLHMLRMVNEREERENDGVSSANVGDVGRSTARKSRDKRFFKTWTELDRARGRGDGRRMAPGIPMKDRFGQ